MPYVGEFAGVGASLLWALCGLFFAVAGRRVGAAAVNQIRIGIAVIVLAIAHAVWFGGGPWPTNLSERQLTELLASGVIGLAIGDLCLFRCMTLIGPRLGALLMATAPPMAAILAVPWIGETIGMISIIAIGIVTLGVLLVLGDRRSIERWERPAGDRHGLLWPVALGLVAALGQAVGVLMSKSAMIGDGSDEVAIEALPATLVRMVGAAVGVIVIAVLGGRPGQALRAFRDRYAMRWLLLGTATGPILGLWLAMVCIEHARAGVAATLVALAPVFMIPIGRIAYGSRVGRVGVLGTVLAVLGTWLLFARD